MVYIILCTCASVHLILTRGIWIIYLSTIQLGTSLVFTFYHQGHWMSLHNNLTHDIFSVFIPHVPSHTGQEGDCFSCLDMSYSYTDKTVGWWTCKMLMTKHGGRFVQWSPHSCSVTRWQFESFELQTLRHTSHSGSSVYSRQFSFLPTIMREIEFEEMFVFLSISPNNNTIPKGLQKHLSSMGSAEN